MKNRYIILSVTFALTLIISCNGKKSTYPIKDSKEKDLIDFCKIHDDDQSYTEYYKTDTIAARIANNKRKEIFENNFNLIISYLRKSDKLKNSASTSNISQSRPIEEKCKNDAMHISFIHSMQHMPKKFFAEEVVELFASGMNNGSFEKKCLQDALEFVFIQNEFCEELRPSITKALEKWGIKKEELRQWVVYQKC